ncbi:hypothetical protein HDK64DRAFT_265022 [Phyllosticta capitalensis]
MSFCSCPHEYANGIKENDNPSLRVSSPDQSRVHRQYLLLLGACFQCVGQGQSPLPLVLPLTRMIQSSQTSDFCIRHPRGLNEMIMSTSRPHPFGQNTTFLSFHVPASLNILHQHRVKSSASLVRAAHVTETGDSIPELLVHLQRGKLIGRARNGSLQDAQGLCLLARDSRIVLYGRRLGEFDPSVECLFEGVVVGVGWHARP